MQQPPSISVNPATGCLVLKPCLETPSFAVLAPDSLVVYVSPTGNDADGGATPGTAVQTLGRAVAIVNSTGWNISAQIRLLPGDYPVSGTAINLLPVYGSQSGPALLITGDSLAVAYTGTVVGASGGTDVPWVLSLSAPVTGALDGGQAEFLTGSLAGSRFTAGNASGTSLSIMYAGIPGPAPGDTFRVLVPTARVMPTSTMGLFAICPLAFADLDFVVQPFPVGVLSLLNDSVIFINGTRFMSATNAPAAIQVLSRLILGLGPNTTPTIAGGAGVALLGVMLFHNFVLLTPLAGTAIIATGCLVQDAQIIMQTGSVVDFGSGLVLRSLLEVSGARLNLRRVQIQDGPGAGVSVDDGAYVLFDRGDISGCAGNGATVRNSRMTFGPVTSALGPNGGVGLELAELAEVRLGGTGGSNTVTGAAGDVIVGANPPVTWATIVAVPASRSDLAAPSPKFSFLAL